MELKLAISRYFLKRLFGFFLILKYTANSFLSDVMTAYQNHKIVAKPIQQSVEAIIFHSLQSISK